MIDLSWLAHFAENNVAVFFLLAFAVIIGKFYWPKIAKSFGHSHTALEKIDKSIEVLSQNDIKQDRAIRDLACEAYKKNVYNLNPDYPLADRIANYVRYKRAGGNGNVSSYFWRNVAVKDAQLVETIFDAMGYSEEVSK